MVQVDTFLDTELCIVEAKSHTDLWNPGTVEKKSKLQVHYKEWNTVCELMINLIFSELQIHILDTLDSMAVSDGIIKAATGGEFSAKENSQDALGNVSYLWIINVWSCKLCVKFVNFQQTLLLRTKIYQLLSIYVFKRKNS